MCVAYGFCDIVDGPAAGDTTTFALQSGASMTLGSLVWSGIVSVISIGPNSLTIGTATMSLPTTVVTTDIDVTFIISSGNVQGTLTSTANSTQSITASILDGTSLNINGVGLTLSVGTLTTVGTGSVTIGSGVTVTSSTLAGAGPYYLDQCTISSSTIITALNICTYAKHVLQESLAVVMSAEKICFSRVCFALCMWMSVY